MASVTKKVLRMTFNNALGNAVTITLANPKADLTAAQVETVMDQIITKNIFLTSGGDFISKRDVKIINTTTDDLFDPPIS
jgi:enamine deaminase RidA (YjgF/YER057c/UK114 family)